MAYKTYAGLTVQTTVQSGDLFASYRGTGPLKSVSIDVIVTYLSTALAGFYAVPSNNLSEYSASAATARANLGLGTVSTLPQASVVLVANNLSELTATQATARTNIGAAPTVAPVFTGGITVAGGATVAGGQTIASGGQVVVGGFDLTGSTKSNIQAVGAADIDTTASDFFTKSISSNTTFTFSGAVSAKAQGFMLKLTTSSGALPTWPASVKWTGGIAPTLGNGTHLLGFVWDGAASLWYGSVFGAQMA